MRTRRAIHAAALRVVQEHGFDKATVDMISTEAGVSPRTFLNYFPNKEAAVLLGPPDEVASALTAEFAATGATHPQDVFAAVTREIVRDLAENPPPREEMLAAFELTRNHPVLLAALSARFECFQRSIAEVVAQRLGRQPEDEMPTLIATVAVSAVRMGIQRWVTADTPSDAADSPAPHVEHCAELLGIDLARDAVTTWP
ncbi:TetR family transcriptional regulator [Streptomyces phaeolivaceus]|uniref:TetR family transcriptional regulator n=1 Tax=Streptomyces phaeolivaceus TaxID=2653200 RepID=A0A5P8KE59_9ACTN|nr:TetR family transcriptional regulator [Streptomyces phaeolivaceus]QFR01566.1 TetR family transcriptional regulator [Streptomyces phaeolivaceus]